MDRLVLTWDDVHKDCLELAALIVESKVEHKGIVAVARGGLFVAGILAHILDIRSISTICARSYTREGVANPEVAIEGHLPEVLQTPYLLVDDLADSGNTFGALLECRYHKATTAALYKKSLSRITPDHYITNIDSSRWIVFPWEV
ncbi:MAG: hypothetical protein KAR06_00415 [Deltaproteobacteria bacterium]|nr:hypothetical protein [Deltaproteobacteria bacterium]